MNTRNVAIVGATGLVGQEFVRILEQRRFPVDHLRLLASAQSAGQTLTFRGEELPVEELSADALTGVDLALFSAGAAVSREFAPLAAKAGATVIDNSSAFRMDPDVPLVVPEVNPQALRTGSRIIANPNCSTIQMVVAAKPLHDAATIKRIVVSTYQAVSGTGKRAVDELLAQTRGYLSKENTPPEVYPHHIAFNLLPHIDTFLENGDTGEERKMIRETRKVLDLPDLAISATCVRVPVLNAHSLSLNLEFHSPLEPEQARRILAAAPGVRVLDEPAQATYPTPLSVSGQDEVFVGRIRKDRSVPHGLNLWVVADNLRKGAALNAVQIAEALL
ncbi:MAG: aspartate-semialdehyde dehydrogenase [Calditrichaeota bacterium]|nr:MAG: aspartate-semialdehyde dehydrogenase [Calditrichota bacterium]